MLKFLNVVSHNRKTLKVRLIGWEGPLSRKAYARTSLDQKPELENKPLT